MSEQTERRTPGPGRPGMGGPGMGAPVEKAKDFKGTWAKLLRYIRSDLPAIVIALGAAALGSILQIIGPDRLKDITNEISKGLPALLNGKPTLGQMDLTAIVALGRGLMYLYLAATLLTLVQSLIMANLTQRFAKSLRKDIAGKINRLPLSYFDRTSSGDILSRVSNDVDAIGQTMNQSLGTLVTSVTTFLGALFMMFLTNWLLALTAVGSSLVGFVIMMVIMKKSQGFFKAQQEGLGNINGHIEEIYSNHLVVKAYNGGIAAKKTFEAINRDLYDSAWKSQFFSGLMMPLMQFIGNFGYVAVCVVGAALAVQGSISFGVIVAFILYVRLFTQPLSQMAQAANNLQRTAAAGERVFQFLGEPELSEEAQKPRALQGIQGGVEFRHVRFGYHPDKTIIHDFSASIEPGQKVAIVGPTGAGKTTLVNLLMRFYDLDGGEILIDGIPIASVPRENVHEQFSMVLQDSWLFEGSICENIIYSKPGISSEAVVEACKTIGLDHFIKTLPQGYDTVLNDKSSISEGQKQLIAIARAMIQNAPLLILDEATSSVDTRTERIVQAAMDRLTVGRTSFVIAHRLSTIKNADLILVMKDGDILESGSHEELLQRKGFYAELYNSQFELAA